MATQKQHWGELLLCVPPTFSISAPNCADGDRPDFACGAHPEPVLMNLSEPSVNLLKALTSTSPQILRFSVA